MSCLEKTDPIFVIGAGVNGLALTHSLLQKGFKNIHLFDKRDYIKQGYNYFQGCDSPSSDMNKIFRAAYGEQTHYQELSIASRGILLEWNKMIKETNFEGGDPIYLNTGNIHLTDLKDLPSFEEKTVQNMGPALAIGISDPDAKERAKKAGLAESAVDPFEMAKRGEHHQGVLDTTGGMIIADKCCRWVLHLCKTQFPGSLTLHMGEQNGELEELLLQYNRETGKKKCVGVKTKDGKVHFARVTVTACGPWTSEVVPEASEKLEATGGTVALIKVTNPEALKKYHESIFPTWTYKVRDGAMGGLYGFPIRNGYMKVGYRGLKWTNPQPDLNSKVKTAYSKVPETNVPLFGLELIKQFIRKHIPEVSKIDKTRLCWYSDSEDNDFLISYCPHYDESSLFTIAGDSGHSFMMIASIGDVSSEILLRTGKYRFLEYLFSWKRKRDTLNSINNGLTDPRALQNQKMATELDWVIKDTPKL